MLERGDDDRALVKQARQALDGQGWQGEVIVSDNGSDDGSAELAKEAGALVVYEPRRGYGSAYLAGLAAAAGEYVVMADADLTYDLGEIPRFVTELDRGADLVMGNRMRGIKPGAMPWLHRYVGNPVLSGILNLFFRTGVSDVIAECERCGAPSSPGSTCALPEWSSPPKWSSAQARHGSASPKFQSTITRARVSRSCPASATAGVTFVLLVHSPNWLFIAPGALMAFLGVIVSMTVLLQLDVFGREWDLHTMVAGALLMIVGTQVVALGLCAHAYGTYSMGERDAWFDRMRARFRLEHGLMLGAALMVAGVALAGLMIGIWADRGFGALSEERLAVLASALFIIGLQVFFSSFLLSILGLRKP